MRKHYFKLMLLVLAIIASIGQMYANGGIGYKGVKFTKNGSATGWYNIHNVSWNYSNASYECRSGQSGVTDFNNADLGTVTTLKLKAFVVIGWTDNEDYVAGQLKYRLYKQSASAPSYSTYNVGNYGTSSNTAKAANVLVSSGNDRVVGSASLTTDIVTASTAPGNYYLQLQGLGRMQWSNGSSHGDFNANDGSEVKATLLVPGFETTSTSQAFGSVNVGSNSSATISFTQHYGTALTTSNCSLTNSTDFQVTGISETGVTVKFKPQTAGDKSCTLTITDADSKTCTITLTGTGKAVVTNTLTVEAGTGISAVTGTDDDISAGDEIAITATVATGYTWDRWTKSGTGTLSTFTAGTKDQTVTIGTVGNITLTASATENMSSLTTSCSYDVGNPGYSAPSQSVSSIGISTQATLTATTPGTGYTFAGWTLSNNLVVTSGDKDHDLSITVRTNGNGAVATAQANYEEDLNTNWKVKGSNAFGDYWATDHWLTKKSGHSTESVGYYTVNFSSTNSGGGNTDFNFKVVNPSNVWYTLNTDGSSDWYYYRDYGERTMGISNNESENINICADIAGPYEIKVDYSTPASPKVTITFPTTYTLTYGIGTVKGNNGSISTSPSTSSGSSVLNGTNITLTGPAPAAGYAWKGWYTNADGTTGKINDTNRAITVTMDADKTLYACYTETTHTVTVAAGAGGTTSPATVTAGPVTKSEEATATPNVGYVFTGWTLPDGVTAAAGYTTSSNPIKVNATAGSKTITANFAAATAFIEGRFHITNEARDGNWTNTFSSGDWEDGSTSIKFTWDGTNNRYELHTYATPHELTTQISNYDPFFYIKESSSSSTLANVTSYWSASSQTLTAAGTVNKKSLVSSGTFHNDYLRFNSSDDSGYAVLYFDEAGVWYELEQTLSYNANGGSGAAPATTYYVSGTNATAAANTFTARTNYSFAGWNTEEYITGADYAAGASVPMTTNITLYAKWNRSVTLDQQDATTDGSTNVIATWNCATLPSITNPLKDGYAFGGWYTEIAGAGNIIINTDGELQPGKTNWTVAGGRFQRTPSVPESESKPLYAKWTQTVTLKANTSNHGSGSDGSATATWNNGSLSSITHCTPATGYHLEGYYTAATGGTKILEADGTFAGSNISDSGDQYIDADGKWKHAGATTLWAHYEPNTYTITLNPGLGGEGGPGSMIIDYDATGFTDFQPADIHQTGYKIDSWVTNDGTKTVLNADGTFAASNVTGFITDGKWSLDGNGELKAHWTPKSCRVDFDFDILDEGYGNNTGATTSITATYAAAMTSVTPPTAKNGWAFMGYFDAADGAGTQYYDGTGASAHAWDKDTESPVTLYAHYEIAQITNIVFDAAVVSINATVGATVTVAPNPTGTTILCFRVLRASNNTDYGTSDFVWDNETKKVTFTAPNTNGSYKLEAKLYTGSSCPGETLLHTVTYNFMVSGVHNVTIQYKCGDASIQANTTASEIGSENWSSEITAPDIFGYTFSSWDAGEGIVIKNGESEASSSSNATIQIKAYYAGTLTANYTKNQYIYIDLSEQFAAEKWTHPYIYLYNADSWTSNGTGGTRSECIAKDAMTNIEGTDIWYYDYGSASTFAGYVAFSDFDMRDYFDFHTKEAIYRKDFSEGTPLFVPLTGQVKTVTNDNDYYNAGYWVTYLGEKTGYYLRIKDNSTSELLKEVPFTSADKRMIMTAEVELQASTTYKFEVKRDNSKYYKNNGGRTYSNRNDSWKYEEDPLIGTILTTATGDYTFKLSYADHGGDKDYQLRVNIDYPVASEDYRLVYKDDVHTGYKPSAVIANRPGERDTVSFFVRPNENPKLYVQTADVNASTGEVTWTTNTSTNLITDAMLTSPITKDSVYNFNLVMDGEGALSVANVKGYTGDFYIRCNALNSDWDNYTTDADHLMTYSAFSHSASNKFGEKFSHYKTKWCPCGTNIKFVVANDYSPCISDTLIKDVGDPYSNMDASGTLNTDGAAKPFQDRYSANVRFMYNQWTNKVSRAYLASAEEKGLQYLILKSESGDGHAIYNSDGSALSGYGEDAANHQAIFEDKENWIYNREIKVKSGTKFKIYACYGVNRADATKAQYFRGGYDGGSFAKADSVVVLVGGDGSTNVNIRVVYDFKTNRLMAAYVPDDTIKGPVDIDADIMLVRYHHEAGKQIVFNGESAELTKVHEVYGVMKFNRWVLNNRQNPENTNKEDSKTEELIAANHPVITDPNAQQSVAERSFYWISFPFDVNLSDVFGFGTYGIHWAIEWYDGAARARDGYWIDSPTFWRIVEDPKDFKLEAGKGYVLALELDSMKYNNTRFWPNNIQEQELFFPSASAVGSIKQTSAQTTADSLQCTIDRTGNNGSDINKNRKIVDSHWNLIGVPSYANYDDEITDGSSAITWQTSNYSLPFLYEWQARDDSYIPQEGSTYEFKAMHSYFVQYHGTMNWSLASATPTPSPVVARYREEALVDQTFRLTLSRGETKEDQTFIRLSNKEGITNDFEFGQDLAKEMNGRKANIYTIVENYIPTAGNSMLPSEQTTVIPVGVVANKNGEYTFSMPDGTEGVGVTLVDLESGERTNLALFDYVVTLAQGTYNERFVLEISPIQPISQGIDEANGEGLEANGVRKVLIDNIMYIIRDGKVFDARGAIVK